MKLVEIHRNDILSLLYFIISKFEQDSLHRQETSSKDDLIGGYIDRWINKIAESVAFNKILLKKKKYSVVNDYFVYDSNLAKNAPDILGLRCQSGKIIKFAEFDEKKWKMCEGMPFIEVKTCKKNQKLFGVRDPQLKKNNYYIIVQTHFKPNYLKTIFNGDLFNKKNYNEIYMDKIFLKNNIRNALNQPFQISPFDQNEFIGEVSVLCIIKGEDLLNYGNKCKEKESVYYIKNIEEYFRPVSPNVRYRFNEFFIKNERNNLFSGSHYNSQIINISVENPEYIIIWKINKGSIYVLPEKDCQIYSEKLFAGHEYKLEISLFDRNSKWIEYFIHKSLLCNRVNREEELINLLDTIYSQCSG